MERPLEKTACAHADSHIYGRPFLKKVFHRLLYSHGATPVGGMAIVVRYSAIGFAEPICVNCLYCGVILAPLYEGNLVEPVENIEPAPGIAGQFRCRITR